MQFKDLTAGAAVYTFNKLTNQFAQGTVMSVSGMQGASDVTININGQQTTYTIPDGLSVAYAGNIVLGTSQDDLMCALNPAYKQMQESNAKFNDMAVKLERIEAALVQLLNERGGGKKNG